VKSSGLSTIFSLTTIQSLVSKLYACVSNNVTERRLKHNLI
jgi:hypothetical protein